jgi:NADPH:quinone reductase-like Zn-dependent oxidoreductase
LKGIDAIIDTVGEKDGFAKSSGVVKPDGAFVSISAQDAGFDPTAHAPLSFAAFYCLKNSATVQDELAAMVAAGTLKVVIGQTFPFTLEGVHAALKQVESGKSNGKNIIHMV